MKVGITTQIIGALVLGVLMGTAAANLLPHASLEPWLAGADTITRVWTNALRAVATPLIIAQLFVAVAGHKGEKQEAAKLGVLIPTVFLTVMVIAAAVSVIGTQGAVRLPLLNQISIQSAPADVPSPAPSGGVGGGSGSGLDLLVPSNLFAAASTDAILALMLFTLVFAIATRKIGREQHSVLVTGFTGLRDALFVVVDWLVRFAPVALFALAFRSAVSSGLELGKVMLGFVVVASIAGLLCTAALYVLATVGGGTSLVRFARAMLPAQIIAVATRSSLATLPALIKESEKTLRVSSQVSALVLPLGGALLKPSRMVTNVVKLVFLAHLLGIHLSLYQIATFSFTMLLLSPTGQGVPNLLSMGTRSMPAYVAAGIPPVYVVLLGTTLALFDVVMTVLNSTSYLAATVVVARFLRTGRLVEPESEPASKPEVFRVTPETTTGQPSSS